MSISWGPAIEEGSNVDPFRVLIVDDHPVFLSGLKMLLDSDPRTQVIGEAVTGTEAILMAAQSQPDAVVIDLHLPDLNGIEATRAITHTSPHIGVLVLTMYDDDDSVFAAMRAGARGYLLKGAGLSDIVHAIAAVAAGTAVFGPSIAQRLIDYFAAQRATAALAPFPQLTDREREILNLIAAGNNNTAIAERLFLSAKTVRNHVSNIFSKLQVADRAQAIVRARKAGLGVE
ncbi:DNA-binding response regulator [Rhizocola hellebori]|uniref:DNA-binding response regulator n=1 Tax=Rhizocola hellebori TaxID=1392758 RepID=A0A8J3QC10_9ACTN|nr:response regulator transcription factor [Rhizocola hellebori]GIH06878.1 DNA-binding response regulator [Rhizocola hellebori]